MDLLCKDVKVSSEAERLSENHMCLWLFAPWAARDILSRNSLKRKEKEGQQGRKYILHRAV